MRPDLFASLEDQYQLPPGLLAAVQHVESRGNPNAVSPKGAQGAFQFMPATAQQYGINPLDPAQAAVGAARMLRDQLDAHGGDLDKTLASYNWGQGNVQRQGLQNAPPETVAYIQQVKAKMAPDPAQVQWDAAPSIDASKVQWDNPATPAENRQKTGRKPVDPNVDPTGTFGANLAAGLGGGAVLSGLGIKQAGDAIVGGVRSILPASVTGALDRANTAIGLQPFNQARAANQQAIDEARKINKPLDSTAGGMFGGAVENAAEYLLPVGALAKGAKAVNAVRTGEIFNSLLKPSTFKAATAAGAVQGAIQPVATGEDRGLNVALGGAAGLGGNALVKGVGRIAQPVTNALTEQGRNAVEILQKAGIKLDAAQQSGSPFLNRLRSSMGDNPFTMGTQRQLNKAQGEGFTSAALQTIGESGRAATSDVMGPASTRIGKVFDDVAARNPVAYDNALQTSLAEIEKDASSVLNQQQVGPIKNQLDEILNKAANNNGAIDGTAYQNIKKNLDRLSGGADQSVGTFARDVRGALDDALQRSTQASGHEADYNALLKARVQWGNMRKIEGAIDKTGQGQISPSLLANIVGQKSNRPASVYGKGNQDLVELAQAGKQLLPDSTPNSGTAARVAMQFAPSAIAGGAEYLHSGDISKAGTLAATAYGAPKFAQYLLNNPATVNYLANGLNKGALRELLLAPQNNELLKALLLSAGPAAALPLARP